MQARDIFRRFAVNALGIDGVAQPAEFVPVLGQREPTVDHWLIDLKVKLEAVDLLAVAKRLIRTQGGKSEVSCRSRHIECFAMPLKNFFAVAELREQWIAVGLVRRRNVIPADFFFRVGINRGAERFSDQLRAKTDS